MIFKKMLALCLVSVICLSFFNSCQCGEKTYTFGDFKYIVSEDNTVTITQYVGSDIHVDVPEKINEYTVTAIGDKAFMSTAIESIGIPNGVESLGWAAFQDCTKLKTIDLPDSIMSIGNECFHNCSAMEYIEIPKNLEILSPGVFGWCCSLKEVVIPNSVREIKSGAFSRCHNMRKITIGKNVEVYGEHCFESCFRLTEVINLSQKKFPGVYVYRQDWGRFNCSGEIVYSQDDGINRFFTTEDGFIFYIYKNDFEENYYLIGYEGNNIDIILPERINGKKYDIYHSAFAEEDFTCACKKINSVVIPNDSVNHIWSYAFRSCENLKRVSLGSGITDLWNASFEKCTSLNEITLPSETIHIGDCAFYGCENLERINIVEKTWYLQSNYEPSFYWTITDPESTATQLVSTYVHYSWRRDYMP